MKISSIVASFLFLVIIYGCDSPREHEASVTEQISSDYYLIVLGIAQDAGYPQAACKKTCCAAHWNGDEPKRHATALGLVDKTNQKTWLFEATPDIREQLHTLEATAPLNELDGIFVTHAHIGHYTGLMQLGREVMGASNMPVYAMPKMSQFLETNGPWDQLIKLKNIALQPIEADKQTVLTQELTVTPFLVPHRDEYSETVGYKIAGPSKSILFIPDINKWGAWEKNIIAEIEKVDVAFIDGTFYANGEIPGRDMSEIPHPFIQESVDLFQELSEEEKSKIHFIHFNHTNPVFRQTSERTQLLASGFQLAYEGQIVPM